MRFKINYILVFLILVFIGNKAVSQPGKNDKVEALRVSFITQKVNFTPSEAQGFWPLYNEYNDKIKYLRRNFRKTYGAVTDFKHEKDAEDFLNAQQALKQSEMELEKEYNEKFKKVIGVKKTALVKIAEEEFKKEIIKTIKGGGDT